MKMQEYLFILLNKQKLRKIIFFMNFSILVVALKLDSA